MQRHWEGAHIREEVERRERELASIALLAREDVDRYIWLSENRPDLAQSAPGPPGKEQMVAETMMRKKKSVSSPKARRKKCYSNRCSDGLVHAKSGRSAEISDLLRFFSTLDVDLQRLLLDAIANHNFKKGKDLAQEGVLVHKDRRKPSLAWEFDHKTGSVKEHQPSQLGRSSCTVRPNPVPTEVVAPCSFREGTDDLSKQQNSCDNEKFGTDGFYGSRSQTAEGTSNSSCRLTNSSGPLRGGCGKADTGDEGVCRDVAIQTRRSLRESSKLNLKARNQIREIAKSLADHSSQTLSRREHTATQRSDEDIENLREQTTVNVLQRWVEPLEQYLSNLQKFEEELREKWLTPEENETTSTSGAQKSDLESICVQRTSDSLRASETQMIRIPSDEVEAQLDEPLSNKKYGGAPSDELTSRPQFTHHEVFEPFLDKSKQENSAIHESRVKPSMKPELWPNDKHFHKNKPERAAANSLASGPKQTPRDSESLRGKSKDEYLAADFRTRKLEEWWPSDEKPLQTTKSKSAPGIFSWKPQLYTVYDPRTLLGKTKREQIPGDKTRQKPEWWPALRRPYSASEIEAMRQKEDTEKATRKTPIKIFTGYPIRRLPTQSSNKSQRKMAGAIESNRKQGTPECIAQQDEGSLKRTLQMRHAPLPSPPLRKSHQEEYRKKMEGLQKAYGHIQKTDRPRNLSTVDEPEQLPLRKSPKCKTGHGGLHTLQEDNIQRPTLRTSITVEEHVCGIITHLKEQVCGIMTQFQPEQEIEVASYLLHQIKTPREANIQAGVLSQNNAQQEFPTMAPVVKLHNEELEDKKSRKKRNQSNFCLQRGIERLADKLIDQAVNEVASELAEFCESVADQMYMAEFMT